LQLEQISAALGVKIGYVYTVLPITGSLIMLYCLINIRNLWVADDVEAL
ncbi:MAG: TRAP transporter small permease, partial [Aestuariibacter sp.]|nr:TRAP transporter small permease [Aestuariibacter sp.]